jgi:hypothetical protein
VTLFQREDAPVHLLHLVNASGVRGASWVAPVPMRDLEVVVPFAGAPRGVTGLVSGRPLAWRATEGRLTVRVPELHLFEAVRIERGGPH